MPSMSLVVGDDEVNRTATPLGQSHDALPNLPPSSGSEYSEESISESESDHNLGRGFSFRNYPSPCRSLLSRTSRAIDTPGSSDFETDEYLQKPQIDGREFMGNLVSQEDTSEVLSTPPQLLKKANSTTLSTLIHPKSRYSGHVPPLPISRERVAVQELLVAIAQQHAETSSTVENMRIGPDEFMEFELTNFAIYLPKNPHHSYELRGLQDLAARSGHSTLLFDGILCAGSVWRYVQAVPFNLCSIGNYGQDIHEVAGDIWIQSVSNKKSGIYYRLNTPSSEYKRFHTDFLWLADLAKHFVDYSQACANEQKTVSVHCFRKAFSQWAQKTHNKSNGFRSWYEKYRSDDFRRAVSANISFLFKESIGVDDGLRKQPIWSELMDKNFIPFQQIKEVKTVVTPYVYDCFKHLNFGDHLKPVVPAQTAQTRQNSQGDSLHLTVDINPRKPVVEIPALRTFDVGSGYSWTAKHAVMPLSKGEDLLIGRQRVIKSIKVGDVLAVTKDGEGSLWKDEVSLWKAADDFWYIYVQGVHESIKGKRSFDALWLYKPSDTCCAKMRYPFPGELFLSDNCTCLKSKIKEDEVIDVVAVAWHGQPSEFSQDLFIRQTYLENERFVTLNEGHKKCEHLRIQEPAASSKSCPKYSVGQTVLVAQTALLPPRCKSKYGLDPFEIIKYENIGTQKFGVLRRLVRRNELDGQHSCRPNELVYSDETSRVEAKKIERTCLVRFYSEAEAATLKIPVPYNRDGMGNAFYITTMLTYEDGRQMLTPIGDRPPKSLIQGFDPMQLPIRKKMRGLDLYCGGGNFGRGLEEGGALHNDYATDCNKEAIHTYHANLHHSQDTKLFFGSVDDQLQQALLGNQKNSILVPQPGEIDFISAGSPCQGFSLLNNNKGSQSALKNQSLVASVAAFVDFYRPKYGLLENVLNMARKGSGRDQDVLSQLVCAIVGMGYQLQIFVLDAWSFGSSQARSRIFVSFAAPGYEPLQHPQLSHSHPPQIQARGLGRLANGNAFGQRLLGPTPFPFVTAGEATGDLPSIGDGRTYSCVRHPDHIMPFGINKDLKLQIEAIPILPRGMTFAKAWNEGNGVMSQEQRQLFPLFNKFGKIRENVRPASRAWGRVDPDYLFNTVTVHVSVSDSRMGKFIHWDQHRPLTVMELRRAQCFPDFEVIVGLPSQQARIIGNSVDRNVALALGLSLREAWEKNHHKDKASSGVTTVTSSSRSLDSTLRSKTNFKPHLWEEQSAEKPSKPKRRASQTIQNARQTTKNTRGLYDASIIEDLLEENHHLSLDTLGFQSSSSSEREPPPTNKASYHRESNSKAVSLKRPHTIFQETSAKPTNWKAPKLTVVASPSSFTREELSLSGKEQNGMRRSTSQPVNASRMNQRLQVALTQYVASDSDYVADYTDELSRDEEEEEETGDSEVAQNKSPIFQSSFETPQPLKKLDSRKTSTAWRKNTAKPKNQLYVSLISDDELSAPVIKSPIEPVSLPQVKKCIPVDNSQFGPYAQTSRNMKATERTRMGRRKYEQTICLREGKYSHLRDSSTA